MGGEEERGESGQVVQEDGRPIGRRGVRRQRTRELSKNVDTEAIPTQS